MHEISLVRTVFRTLEGQFTKDDLQHLQAVSLKIGKLSNVEPTLFRNAWKAVVEEMKVFEGVRLEIEHTPIQVYCKDCDTTTTIDNYSFRCSMCGLPNNYIVSGEELLIGKVWFSDDCQAE